MRRAKGREQRAKSREKGAESRGRVICNAPEGLKVGNK